MTKLHFLTSLSFGVYSPRRSPYRALLPDHENKRFVIIVLREEPHQADGRFGKAFQRVINRFWDKKNPFSWGDDSPAHRVVALEVDWSSIVGIDYRCPLHDDGKLVLEARQVVKRCFKTVEDARDFYSPRAPEVDAGLLRTSYSAAPTPSKMSLDDRQALLASISSAHFGAHLPLSPRYLRPVASADVRAAAAAAGLGASISAGNDWCVVGRGRVPNSGLRLGAEPGPRSVSATRAPRAGAAAVHVGRAVGTRAVASGASRSSCMDYASADEGEGGSRHRRPAAAAVAAAGLRGGAAAADGGIGVTGGAVRRRLQLRAVESMAGSGQGEAAAAGTRRAVPLGLDSSATRAGVARQNPEASPRKAKSVNDLCAMEAAQRERIDAPAASTLAGTQSVEWSARAAAAGVRISTVHRSDAVCNASWDYGSLAGAGSRGCGSKSVRNRGGGDGGTGVGIGCSNSVDSLRAAFMSQQQQHLVAKEVNLRRRYAGGGDGRVRREAASWTQLSDAGLDGGEARGGGGGNRVPRASRWTQPSAIYCSNTLVLSFRDPFLPQELRRFVKSDMRLLKLYESGLPPWAVFMPCYGLPYRPWLRRALWLLFIAISVFSMGCGFYDLYKNVPFLKQVVTAVASRMYLPASELFEWLERHTQIRMSILLTYLFSKSPLLVSLMRMLRSLAALLQQLLRPLAVAVSAALQPLLAAVQVAAASVGGGVTAAGSAVWQATQPMVAAAAVSGREVAAVAAALLGPPARALWAVAVLLAQLVRLVAALVGMVLVGPVQLACSIGGALSWAGAEVAEQLAVAAEASAAALQWMLTLGRAARRAAPAVKAGARLAAQAAGSAAGGGGLSGGVAVWHWLGLEVVGAYNAVRLTFLQAIKSAQAVTNFCVTVANTAVQHRVSLLLQLRRFITRQKERLPPSVAASVPLPAFVSMPSFASIPAFDIPLPGPDSDEDLLDEEPELGAGLAAAPADHSLYDLDMVLLGTSEDDIDVLASEPQQLYGSDDGVGVRRNGLTEPIPIPLGGGGGAGLLRRRFRSVVGSRLGPSGGDQLYSMFEMPRQRLDAVDEEELEDGQQHKDGDSLREAARASDRNGLYYLRDRRRLAVGPRGATASPWTSHRVGLETARDEAEAEDEDYLTYASAPGCRNAGQGGGLLADDLSSGSGLRASLSSPSRRQGRGPECVPLSRSVPADAAHTHGLPSSLGQQASVSQKQQPHQKPLSHKQQQQQSRRSKRLLRRSASLPSDGALTAAASDAVGLGERACGSRGRNTCGPAGSDSAAAVPPTPPAVTAGAVATGAVRAGPASSRSSGAAPIRHGACDALTCSSPFVRGHCAASASAGGFAAVSSSSAAGPASDAAGGGEGIVAGGKVAGSSDDCAHNKGRGGGAGGANNACGKRPSVGAKHASRQPAIQAA